MNTVYNASAGTGKTWQVTRLYEDLVLKDGIDPRRILLMTFTINAAAELRMRVARGLLKARRTAEAEGDDDTAERAITAMSHLPAAPIGTIHSFCTRLLREHALEAGLSPGFSVLDEDRCRELLDQICRDQLIEQLETDPDFKTFCSGVQIIAAGKGFGSSVTETVPALIQAAGSLGIPLENAEAMLPEPEPAGSIEAFQAILDRLHELPNPTAKAKPFIQALEELIPACGSVEQLVQGLRERGLKGKKFGGGRGHKPISDDFFELFNRADDAVRYRERFPAAKAFARYVQAVCTRYRQRKHEMDAVDFDDQLRLAAELISSGRARPEFDYIIVDEVQDTSRVQCELIRSLWHPDEQEGRPQYEQEAAGDPPALVICGDRKQSIYTWRGADPDVMPDLEREILAAAGSRKTLQTSYRSAQPILDIVNRLFASVYGPDEYTEDQMLQSNPGFTTPDEKPCVEFLQADVDEDLAKTDKVAAEMEAVAQRIRLLVGDDPAWRPRYRFHDDGFSPAGNDNAYRYSDILILLQRTTHQSVLEHALQHAGIPYTLGGKGRGLFTRQEARDVSLFLNVITNPMDAWSLIGFLRSPWIGLSDEAIAELAWKEDGFSIDHLMAHFSDESAGSGDRPAAELIRRYRKLPGIKLASELVRMLIEETGYDALLAGLPRGAQRLANLRKVIDWLRETERGARTTPAMAARRLAERIEQPPNVPEAAVLDPAQNAVTIMTVHGAKGLSRRVVFLPDVSARPQSDTSLARVFFDKHKVPRFGVKISAPDRSEVRSPGFNEANDRAKAVREHESRNLFYVAMTRARDLVVVSASVGRRGAGWYNELQPLIGGDIPTIPYTDLRRALRQPGRETVSRHAASELAAVLESLRPPPEQPKLRRLPATRLARESDRIEPDDIHAPVDASDKAAALGSLGHAVLEQLALSGWDGSVDDWIERLRDEFNIGTQDAAGLKPRIEAARKLMCDLTAGQELRPELPFVMHDADRLIDGTIDLLCRTDDEVAVFDYKFTESDVDTVLDTYRGQMEIYCKAASRAFPESNDPKASLVVIADANIQLVSVKSS